MLKQLYAYLLRDRERFSRYRDVWIDTHYQEWKAASEAVLQANQGAAFPQARVEEAEFTVFDLETTGLAAHFGDEILSIGAVQFTKDNPVSERFYSLVHSSRPVPAVVTELTGLTGSEDAEAFPLILKDFLSFTEGRILAAHPASFDVPFLETMCRRWNLPVLKLPVLDSAKLASLLYPSRDTSLDALLHRFHLPERKGHHALYDAESTAQVLQCLLQKAAEKNYRSLSALIKDTHRVTWKRRRL